MTSRNNARGSLGWICRVCRIAPASFGVLGRIGLTAGMVEIDQAVGARLHGRMARIRAARQAPEFAAFADIAARPVAGRGFLELDEAGVGLCDGAFSGDAVLAFYLRWGLEAAWLLRAGMNPGIARLAAARAAAQFVMAEWDGLAAPDQAALPGWVKVFAGDLAPEAAMLRLAAPEAEDADLAAVRGAWADLGTAEALMETGGDIRLQRDPVTELNGYGCSHRPRPWAVTFASSTASSSSERGYAAADFLRLHVTEGIFGAGRRPAVARALREAQAGIAEFFGLREGCEVVLAASGTDTELLALALTHIGAPHAPVRNILVAPEETGRGVPMAARGVHFAVNTALGADVVFEAPIEGFRPDTAVTNVPLRGANGLRAIEDVEAEILAAVAAGIAAGEKVLLHGLDLSKTGLLAPGPAFLRGLRKQYGQKFDIVIDACQARLSPASVQNYLALDAVVLVTGSKFFTGPPFAGAAILPPAIVARLRDKKLPAGLDAYFGRDEFPACAAAENLPESGNFGLALRWHAALAEMRAFARVPAAQRARILARFEETVERKIGENQALRLLRRPAIFRGDWEEDWERRRSIFSFSLRAPHAPERNLDPAEARKLYVWLNADLSAVLPDHAAVAARICHIGQPVCLPQFCGEQGVLRVSAGARLIAGEPSHEALDEDARIVREMADLAIVLDKIALILENWDVILAADPAPCYRVIGSK